MKTALLGIVVVGIIAVAAATAYFAMGSTSGTLVVGVTDSPIDPCVTHIYLTITDISLQSTTNATATFHVNATSFDLLALTDSTKFLGSAQIPVGNYTMLRFTVTSATATVAGVNVTLNVPSGVVKVAFASEKLEVRQGSTTRLVLDINPVMTNVSASYNLRPEVTVKSITYVGGTTSSGSTSSTTGSSSSTTTSTTGS